MKNKRMIEDRELTKMRYGYRLNDWSGRCFTIQVVGATTFMKGNFRKHLYKVNGHSRKCRRCGSGVSMMLAS